MPMAKVSSSPGPQQPHIQPPTWLALGEVLAAMELLLGPWNLLDFLLCELLQGRVAVVHLFDKLQVPLLGSVQVLPRLVSLLHQLLHLSSATANLG